MAGITLEQAQTQLDNFLEASTKVANGQAYSIGGRSYTRADAEEIRNSITYWDDRVKRLSRTSRIRARRVTPIS